MMPNSAPMVKGILWDNDGVLVDTERLFFKANQDFFKHHHIDLTEQQFFDWYLVKNHGAWHLLPESSQRYRQHFRAQRDQLYTEYLRQEQDLAIDGISQLLADLSPRIPMGVVTSARAEHFQLIHSRLALLPHFQFVITEEMVSESKPSPEPYLMGLSRLNLSASDCLVIEDSPRGLAASRAAGIPCIVLRHELMRDYAFEGAYRIVDSVAELAHEIKQLV